MIGDRIFANCAIWGITISLVIFAMIAGLGWLISKLI